MIDHKRTALLRSTLAVEVVRNLSQLHILLPLVVEDITRDIPTPSLRWANWSASVQLDEARQVIGHYIDVTWPCEVDQ